MKISDKYYFFIPYFKKLGTFFASDIYDELQKDDLYFNRGAVRAGIEYYIEEDMIMVSDVKYKLSNGRFVKKYIWRG